MIDMRFLPKYLAYETDQIETVREVENGWKPYEKSIAINFDFLIFAPEHFQWKMPIGYITQFLLDLNGHGISSD